MHRSKEIRSLANTVTGVLKDPVSYFEKKNYIFVISHMRSYSSLLCHILGSHEEICGYAEMHQSYSSWVNLMMLRHKTYVANDNVLDGRYLLDKLLHNKHAISEAILSKEKVKLLFLLRKPEAAMKSMINMGKGGGKFGNLAWVSNYYLERLLQIQDYVQKSRGKSFFVQAERIIEDTDSLLDDLSRWLELGSRLTPKYSIFKHTGARHYGDPSRFIRRGEIVRTVRDYRHIDIPADVVWQAKEAYAACRNILVECADTG
ncbi:MAG: hypothetical protein SWH78_10250 [Thermodesulfobacteriota bacterium]|nr:hypothetical protein [Thermodesulfobacteriota bacterium]